MVASLWRHNELLRLQYRIGVKFENGMIVGRIVYLGLIVTVLANLPSLAENNLAGDVNCQFGKSSRKQVNAEPLNGTCLRDIVIRLSNEFRSITDAELGLTSFQQILDAMEFTNITGSLNTRLILLVDKLNNKLLSYVELLRQSYNVVKSILAKNEGQFAYSGIGGLDTMSSKLSDFCSQITQGNDIGL